MSLSRLAVPAAMGLACSTGLAAPVSTMTARQEALLDRSRLGTLEVGERVVLEGFPLDGTRSVDLELERFSVLAPGATVLIVDELGIERDAGDLGVVLLRGTVAGEAGSSVFVSLSPYGTQGYIQDEVRLISITSGGLEGGAGRALADDLGLRVADTTGVRPGARPAAVCGGEDGDAELEAFAQFGEAPQGYSAMLRSGMMREAELAIETDYQYTANIFGGNASAAAAYIQTLIGAVSQVYERDLNTRLSVSWSRVFSANNDPYPDTNADGRLDHLKAYWDASMSGVSRDAVHMLSGMYPSWGGKAYVSTLCNSGYGSGFDYGVSAHLHGTFPDPLSDYHWNNWDLMVVAHELGHNFGTGHTHSTSWYNPVIDGCGLGQCGSARGGTIMSYCHACPGGMSNIRLGFHERVVDNIMFYLDFYARCVTQVQGGACGPADVNADGVVNLDDIEAFAQGAISGDLGASDCTGDGVFSLDDVQCFVTAFLAGCG